MKIGFIGLGKMGFNMVHRLLNDKHEVVVCGVDMDAVLGVCANGISDNVIEFSEVRNVHTIGCIVEDVVVLNEVGVCAVAVNVDAVRVVGDVILIARINSADTIEGS